MLMENRAVFKGGSLLIIATIIDLNPTSDTESDGRQEDKEDQMFSFSVFTSDKRSPFLCLS